MKFTKIDNSQYTLHDGEFVHNHELNTAVLDPEILNELDHFSPTKSKASSIL